MPKLTSRRTRCFFYEQNLIMKVQSTMETISISMSITLNIFIIFLKKAEGRQHHPKGKGGVSSPTPKNDSGMQPHLPKDGEKQHHTKFEGGVRFSFSLGVGGCLRISGWVLAFPLGLGVCLLSPSFLGLGLLLSKKGGRPRPPREGKGGERQHHAKEETGKKKPPPQRKAESNTTP